MRRRGPMRLEVRELQVDRDRSEWDVRAEVYVRIPPTERVEFASLLRSVGEEEVLVASDKGSVRFSIGSVLEAEATDLAEICFSLIPDVVRYLSDSVEQHWREDQYHPFECSFKEFGATIRPRSKDVIIQATSFFDVRTEAEMEQFLTLIGGFRDSVLREVALVGREYVDTNGWMYNSQSPADARMVIQTQFPQPACIEIVLEGLQVLRLERGWSPDEHAIGILTDDGSVIPSRSRSIKAGSEMALAKSMRYRVLGREYLGRQLHAVKTDI
jgi:hypothetical protein